MADLEEQPRRVFISYGHDEHAELARRLKKDLRERGHDVWLDSDHLVPGTPDWEHSIERGIDWVAEIPGSGRMVFLVTPHSARRPDGFCLNELSRALMKKLPIVPVMVVWCELPLSICRIQWLDMQDSIPLTEREERYAAGLVRLCEAIEHYTLDQQGTQPRLHALLDRSLLDFEADIERHLDGFEGRQWLMDAVDAWLAAPDSRRLFWLTGRPGSGKSVFAAWLCRNRREIAASFLCDWNNAHKSDPRNCVLSIALQLGGQLQDYQDRLKELNLEELAKEPDAVALFETLVAAPLSRNFPRPDRNVVVVIDALDEATRNGSNRIAELLAKCLEKTPLWFKAFVTSRPDQEVLRPLQAFSPVEMDTFSEQNARDIRAYLAKRLPGASGAASVPEETVRAVAERCDGIFLYARWVLEELRQGRLSLDRLEAFPKGLGGCYLGYFQRRFPPEMALERYKTEARPLLEIMAAARTPLAMDYAAQVLGWDEYDMEERAEAFGSLLSTTDGALRPFHRTLMEWLEDKGAAGPYRISRDKGHARLAEAGWAQYAQGVKAMGDYPRDHLAAHLVAAKRWEDAKKFLADPEVMERTMEGERRYDLLALWLTIGDRLDMVRVYSDALDALEASGAPGEHVAAVCELAALFLNTAGKYPEALRLAQKGLDLRMAVFGEDSLETGSSAALVARLLWTMARYTEAEPLFRSVLTIREKHLGADHPSVAESLNDLGVRLNAQGDRNGAEAHHRRALAIQEKALGPEHTDVATSLCNLGIVQAARGDLHGAEVFFRRDLAILEKVLGTEHRDVAISLNNLGVVLSVKGDLDGAEKHHRRALAIREKALGPEHTDVAALCESWAVSLHRTRRLGEAEKLYRRAMAIYEKVLGPEHPDSAHCRNDLSLLLKALDNQHKGNM